MSLGRAAIVAALLGSATARAASQEPMPRYSSAALACAVFEESVRTKLRGESGSAAVEDRAGRDGVVAMSAHDTTGGLAIEVWFDSLAVWRQTGQGRETPDTEGVIGGRYRGLLEVAGRYHSRKVPFVPDELADVSDLAGFVAEFFPRLPAVALAVGQRWSDTSGLAIRRMADLRGRATPIQRYQWTWNRRQADVTTVTDSLSVTVDQTIRETGEMAWSAQLGPLSWNRRLEITARIPPKGGVRQSVTSNLSQDINVARRLEVEPCH
jgi:hypothetical protein